MSATWRSSRPPPAVRLGAGDWSLALLRGAALGGVTLGGLAVLLALRLAERPIYGSVRPVTPYIAQGVCRAAFIILGVRLTTQGRPMRGPGAVVANHASWLDIFALNAPQRVYFVAKSEVARWPVIGWLARATGTVFINRAGREARAQTAVFERRLRAGHRLAFFPEGTSTDGMRVLPFKTTLFEAFFTNDMKQIAQVQPVSVRYRAPAGADPRLFGWWGDMDFGGHFAVVLARGRGGAVEVVFHDPVPVRAFEGRKALAAYCEARVRSGLPRERSDECGAQAH